jgi:hypothetical protein
MEQKSYKRLGYGLNPSEIAKECGFKSRTPIFDEIPGLISMRLVELIKEKRSRAKSPDRKYSKKYYSITPLGVIWLLSQQVEISDRDMRDCLRYFRHYYNMYARALKWKDFASEFQIEDMSSEIWTSIQETLGNDIRAAFHTALKGITVVDTVLTLNYTMFDGMVWRFLRIDMGKATIVETNAQFTGIPTSDLSEGYNTMGVIIRFFMKAFCLSCLEKLCSEMRPNITTIEQADVLSEQDVKDAENELKWQQKKLEKLPTIVFKMADGAMSDIWFIIKMQQNLFATIDKEIVRREREEETVFNPVFSPSQ